MQDGAPKAKEPPAEHVVLVDENDNVLGYEDKETAHNGEGKLHRAISIFIFNEKGEMLIHRRAEGKRLWGGYWTNSCCSHPRKGEDYLQAAERRLQEELKFSAKLRPLFKFQYQAKFEDKGSENELDQVFAGRYDGEVNPNPDEIAEFKFIAPEALVQDMAKNPGKYTPWFKKVLNQVIEAEKTN
ncbi:MAG: isopentenyl-diphosphate Delta-isomerase [Candidatus Diapherotrites archaeon]